MDLGRRCPAKASFDSLLKGTVLDGLHMGFTHEERGAVYARMARGLTVCTNSEADTSRPGQSIRANLVAADVDR